MNINDNTMTQLTLSYELLLLLQWMITHEKDKMRKIVHKAVKSELRTQINKLNSSIDMSEDLHHNVSDFFAILELFLHDAMAESPEIKAVHQKLLSTVDQIDSTICDSQTLEASIQCTSSMLNQDPSANAKDLLYKELIKRWKPTNKTMH